jgi:hypothetical protein
MKYIIPFTALILCSYFVIGQEKEERHILKTDSLWAKEIFELPTGFAREMTLTGFEDASFPKGWSDPESPAMWSYIFAWSASEEKMVPTQEIVDNLELYFDGLMDVRKDTLITGKPPATALLAENTRAGDVGTYTGKVRTFDRFRSNEMMTLHLLAEQYHCEKEKRTIIVFRFSPKSLDHSIWELLKEVPLIADACERK